MSIFKSIVLRHRNVLLGMATLVGVMAIAPMLAAPVQAQPTDPFGFDPVETNINISNSNEDARIIIVRLINFALSFLGLVAVILILWGGFKWMTAGGNDEQVGEAKKIIIAAVIGLAIIMSAYAITQFFVTALKGAVSGQPTP